MKQNNDQDVEREVIESSTSSGSKLDQEEMSAEEEEEKQYKTGKPKRVTIRSRITHD